MNDMNAYSIRMLGKNTILYLLGVIVAVVTARMLRKFWFKADETPFVMELPPYRIPTMRATLRNMWSKAEQYLRKIGSTNFPTCPSIEWLC